MENFDWKLLFPKKCLIEIYFIKKIMCEFLFFSSLSVSQSMQCLFFMSQNIIMRKKKIWLPRNLPFSPKRKNFFKLRWDSNFENKRVEIVNRVRGSKRFLVKLYCLFSFSFCQLTQHNITFQYLTERFPSYPWMGDSFFPKIIPKNRNILNHLK